MIDSEEVLQEVVRDVKLTCDIHAYANVIKEGTRNVDDNIPKQQWANYTFVAP